MKNCKLRTFRYLLFIICSIPIFSHTGISISQTITTGSLVREMIDLSRLSEFPEPSYKSVQFSSYDRRSIHPDAPGWFANSDGFGREPIPGFEEVIKEPGEDNIGEYLMCDVKGPGAIVRLWTALINGEVRLYLDDLSQPIKAYPCSTGENSGPKTRKNDRKTPEGIYFVTRAYEEEELTPIYGVYAFPLDYPNPFDKMEGKKGYGIWFHGLNKPLRPNDSNGCIAMNNWDIADLAHYIRIGETPVVITQRLEIASSYRLDLEASLLKNLIGDWRKAWQSKEIERYMSHYHSSFRSEGKSWDPWKTHKAKLATLYEEIQVAIQDMWIFQNDGLAMALFYQHFKAPGFESFGKKRLYLRQNSTEWKIIGEFYREVSKKLWPVNTPAPEMPPEKKKVFTLYGQH